MLYRLFLKPILFSLDPERAHHLTTTLLQWTLKIPLVSHVFRARYAWNAPKLEKKVMGLTFKNPIGLAAGFDKDGKHYGDMAALGFGFIEIGTVTPRPQPGNPKPRLFRLPADQALINRMGFNNAGVDPLAAILRQGRPDGLVIGGNIGKNKDTPNEKAVEDYLYCLEKLHGVVDYFVVNVSSPNTPGLRELQEKAPLTALLHAVQEKNQALGKPKPILLKIAPDLTQTQVDDILDIVKVTGIAGVIATNTTIDRAGLKTPTSTLESIGAGGLSGAPVHDRSLELLKYLRQNGPANMVLIGVGGIHTAAQAKARLEAGADLIQVYTALVYEGPSLVKRILKGLKST